METKYNYARVGAFVLILSLTLISAIIWLTVGTERKSYTQYQIITEESVSGLSLNSPVAYRGVEVGKVIDLKLDLKDPRFVIILVDIEEQTPIKTDTAAILAARGITGLMNIELTGGSPESKILLPPEGQKLATITNGPSLGKRLDDAFTQIASQVSDLSSQTGNFLSAENADAVKHILKNTQALTAELASSANEFKSAMNDISSLAKNIKPQLQNILLSADKSLSGDKGVLMRLNGLINNIEKTFAYYDALAIELTKTSTSWDKFAATTDKRVREVLPRFNSMLIETQGLVGKFKSILEDIEKNPDMFIFGKPASRKGPGE